MSGNEFKESDRVKRKDGAGCEGMVKEIREELTSSVEDSDEKAVMIQVLWDNGTLSYMSPEALETA